MKCFWKLVPNTFILCLTPQYSHAASHKLHSSPVSQPHLTFSTAVAFHLSWYPCLLHAEMIGYVKWKAMGTLHGMDIVVAVPWSWSPLLAQCTRPPAAVGWQLKVHSCPLLLCTENCLWLNQELLCPVGLPQDWTVLLAVPISALPVTRLWLSLAKPHSCLALPLPFLSLEPSSWGLPSASPAPERRCSFRQLWRR